MPEKRVQSFAFYMGDAGLSVLCTDARPGQCTYPFRYERLFKLFSIVFLELVLVSVEEVGFADE